MEPFKYSLYKIKWNTHDPKSGSHLNLKVQRKFMSQVLRGDLEETAGSWLRFGVFILYDNGHFDTNVIEMWLSILILKLQSTYISFKSWFWALKNFGGSWLVFGIYTLVWMWSLVLKHPCPKFCLSSLNL